MTITFNQIPSNMRVPGFYFEFDSSKANSGSFMHHMVVLGQRLTTGNVAAGVPVTVTRLQDAEIYFGKGAQLTQMLKYLLSVRPNMKISAIALDDLPAGFAATGKYAVTGSMSTNATMIIEAAGETVKLAVAAAQTQSAIASAMVAAISAQLDFPVTAVVNGTNDYEVDLTARHKGEYGNDIVLDVWFESAAQPTAPTIAITAMAGGTGNPDITDAISAMGDEWYNWIVNPWTDATNMGVLELELTDRFGPIRQIGCRAFIATPGSYGTAAAYGDSRNHPHVTCMGTGLSSTAPWCWAAVNAVVAANSLSNDPSRQLSSLPLPGIKPPAREDRFTFDERNLLLFDGISTYTVDAGGNVLIEAQITMYQEDAQGNADDSMLFITVPELADARRRRLSLLFAPHARDKFMDDGNNIPAGQPIMTPNKGKVLLAGEYREGIEELGWYEDFDSWIESLIVEKQDSRLAIVDQPNYVENLRQVYMRDELVT
jgi:phage tail sheath gpL-like